MRLTSNIHILLCHMKNSRLSPISRKPHLREYETVAGCVNTFSIQPRNLLASLTDSRTSFGHYLIGEKNREIFQFDRTFYRSAWRFLQE